MTYDEAAKNGLSLVESSEAAMLATLNEEGYPEVRALSKITTDGIKEAVFVTRGDSRHAANIRRNPRCCVYFVDAPKYHALSLVGSAEVLCDTELKRKLWRPAFQGLFKNGIEDPEYCVLRFTTLRANLRWGIESTDIVLSPGQAHSSGRPNPGEEASI